jgi:hypothetical protein
MPRMSKVELYAAIRRDHRGAELLFQVLTEREEKNSVAIASNEPHMGGRRRSPIPDSARPSSTA